MNIPAIYQRSMPSLIDENLWQGGFPRRPNDVVSHGIGMIVLAAQELQPTDEREAAELFPGVRVICAPMEDDGCSRPNFNEVRLATNTATEIVRALRDNQRVLVTCYAGRNRSGLISALALIGRHRLSGTTAVEIVQRARPGALTNTGFVSFLSDIRRV